MIFLLNPIKPPNGTPPPQMVDQQPSRKRVRNFGHPLDELGALHLPLQPAPKIWRSGG